MAGVLHVARPPFTRLPQFEFVVKGPGFENHNLSVITNRESDNTLFTLTILSPEELWQQCEQRFRQVADSFHVDA